MPAIRNARTIVALPYPAARAMKRRITHARKSPDVARPTANVLHTKSASTILVPSKRAQNRDIRHPARRDTRKTALPRVPTARAIPVRRTPLPTLARGLPARATAANVKKLAAQVSARYAAVQKRAAKNASAPNIRNPAVTTAQRVGISSIWLTGFTPVRRQKCQTPVSVNDL